LGRGVDVKKRESGRGEEEDGSWNHSGTEGWEKEESDVKLTVGIGFEVVISLRLTARGSNCFYSRERKREIY